MSMAESKVTGIIKSLNALEDDLDSLNGKVSDIRKQILLKTQSEIDGLLAKVQEMATNEAETIINASKERAVAESAKITQKGEARLSEIQSNIDAHFDEAVEHVVSTILKA